MPKIYDQSDSTIRFCDVSLKLNGVSIFNKLSICLGESRIAVIGQNGSGKSTFLKVMAGLIKPQSGSVTIGGADPFRERRSLLLRLGILFQNPEHQILFPTVIEELTFGLKQQGYSRQKAEMMAYSMLVKEGRAEWTDALIANLSQGQKHWLCLQSILLMAPQTILLDEPFVGLDLPTKIRLSSQLDVLPQRLISVTHEPDLAKKADRVVWFKDGKIYKDGSPKEVLPMFMLEMEALGGQDADLKLS